MCVLGSLVEAKCLAEFAHPRLVNCFIEFLAQSCGASARGGPVDVYLDQKVDYLNCSPFLR